jgi:polar amino acid transport system substrate-binding protein
MMRHSTALLAFVTCLSLVALGCSDSDEQSSDDTTTTEATETTAVEEEPIACDPAAPPTVEDGKLVVATGEPAFEPWVVDDDPANGQGYESAVVYAVADQLGFAEEDVTWTRTGFDEAIAPGDKDYDVNVQQYSITTEREEVVDFSDAYYEVEQALVGAADGPVADATSLADLKDAKFGAVLGTTSLDYIEEYIQPTTRPQVFDDTTAAAAALRDGQVEGLVLDLPTAYTLLAVELPDASILGVLPSERNPEQLAFVLIEDSGLTGCVDAALATLRDDGTLAALVEQWLHGAGDIPTLER